MVYNSINISKGPLTMTQDKFNSIISDAINDCDLNVSDIPSIDLYLEQIINLISDKNALGSKRFKDRIPTKTMVNNYSKAGLITPLTGKTYNKDQIVQILLTNSLKNTLSIAEIKGIMTAFELKKDESDILSAYSQYINIKNEDKSICPKAVQSIIEENNLNIENNMDCLTVVLATSALADYFKCISKALLQYTIEEMGIKNDEETPEVSEKELKKAQKKAEKKAEKAQKKAEKEEKEEKDTKSDIRENEELESEYKKSDDLDPKD